ncbi:hypothetical protein PIROE2DRAFT_5455 [Piromyces sp. E2]|nr:hypothetical protein PIROE2DRAFT_5455 [Piromyces sp. E2]|eukprot:OUM67187.1 hypothetical protein PIROE2DRAFT_5455 [Piromyces sp. E2]
MNNDFLSDISNDSQSCYSTSNNSTKPTKLEIAASLKYHFYHASIMLRNSNYTTDN